MDRTDVTLILTVLCALELFLGAVAALVVAAFVAGVLFQQHRRPGGPDIG